MTEKIFETNRLVLKTMDQGNFNDLYKLLSNKNVHKYFPKTLDQKETKTFIEKAKKKYEVDGYWFWVVSKKGNKEFIGICGLVKQIIDGVEEIEVGYRINDIFWGNGYGTEAALGCMNYAENKLKKRSVISLILEVNRQSIRVAEKNGMFFEKEVVFHSLVHRLYRTTFSS